MMEIELTSDHLAKQETSKAEEDNLYSKLQELNKYLDFLSIQEEYIKDDQIKLKRYSPCYPERNCAPKKNSNASRPCPW
jgi:hypothetical protein